MFICGDCSESLIFLLIYFFGASSNYDFLRTYLTVFGPLDSASGVSIPSLLNPTPLFMVWIILSILSLYMLFSITISL